MADEDKQGDVVRAGLSESEMRTNAIRLAFGGDEARFEQFSDAIRAVVPPETAVVLRGSAVTGTRWEDGAPFDSEGPGTSDLDLTFVGSEVLVLFHPETGFYVPGVHTKPLTDGQLDIAPVLVPLRQKLSRLAGRPVNIQATRDFWMLLREVFQRQPYLTLVGKLADEVKAGGSPAGEAAT
jgi:hypothetical protein